MRSPASPQADPHQHKFRIRPGRTSSATRPSPRRSSAASANVATRSLLMGRACGRRPVERTRAPGLRSPHHRCTYRGGRRPPIAHQCRAESCALSRHPAGLILPSRPGLFLPSDAAPGYRDRFPQCLLPARRIRRLADSRRHGARRSRECARGALRGPLTASPYPRHVSHDQLASDAADTGAVGHLTGIAGPGESTARSQITILSTSSRLTRSSRRS